MKYNRFIQIPPEREALEMFCNLHRSGLIEFLQDLKHEYSRHIKYALDNVNEVEPMSVNDYIFESYNGFSLPQNLLAGLLLLYSSTVPEYDLEAYNQACTNLQGPCTDLVTENEMLYDMLVHILTPTERLQYKTLDRDTITSRQLNLELNRLQTIIKHIISLT